MVFSPFSPVQLPRPVFGGGDGGGGGSSSSSSGGSSSNDNSGGVFGGIGDAIGGVVGGIGDAIGGAFGYDGGGDMTDGGGPGQSGDTFGGMFGGISNAIGATPEGSGIDPTGIAGVVDGYMDARGTTGGLIGGIVGGLLGGLPGAVVGTMVTSGKMNLGLNPNAEPGQIDAQISAIANDPDMGDGEKQQKITETITNAAKETAGEMENAGASTGGKTVQQMAEEVYNGSFDAVSQFQSAPQAEDYIKAIYQSELGRGVDEGGLQNYLNMYNEGTLSLEDIAKAVSSSEEGMAYDPSNKVLFNQDDVTQVTDYDKLVTQIYQRELGRLPDEEGKQFYIEALKSGRIEPEQVARNISDSGEGVQFDPTKTVAFGQGENAGRRPGDILNDPTGFLTGKMASLQDNTPQMNPTAAGTNLDPNAYNINPGGLQINAQTAQTAGDVGTLTQQNAQTYNAATSADRIAQSGQATAQQGTVSDQSTFDAEQVDVEATADGTNAVGGALNNAQTLDISRVIDTSTVSGRMLADRLGEGNYTDAKATVKGQLEVLSGEFTDSVTGEPKIPSWAAGAAREVSRIAAFKGMTGTAATAAMSQALMESSLPIAQQDAQFFQTATMENMNNRQQMAVTKAQVLSNMEMANLDARMTAAVENSKAFLQMDLSNLDNRQQTEIVNTQARVQSILEDSKAENSARLFAAESQNDFTKFYGQLNTQIRQFNNEQRNAMERFNAGEINDTRQFNAQLENQREQFYQEMQYNVDLANARWRQTVETANTEMQFDAAKTDVQNIVQLSQESLNRLWDRADSILDYTWRTSETALDREVRLTTSTQSTNAQMQAAEEQGKGALWGGIIGAGAKILAADPFDWF